MEQESALSDLSQVKVGERVKFTPSQLQELKPVTGAQVGDRVKFTDEELSQLKPAVKSSDTQTYFRQETGKTVSADLGLDGKHVEYLDDTQNNLQKKTNYLGFVNLGGIAQSLYDNTLSFGKGAAGTAVSIAGSEEAGTMRQIGEAQKEVFQNKKYDDMTPAEKADFIAQANTPALAKMLFGSIRDKTLMTGWISRLFYPEKDYGLRADGTKKSTGFLGVLQRPDGKISSEISIGVEINGKETEIPTLVPTLTKEEVNYLLDGNDPTDVIIKKAVDHAKIRMQNGQSPFYQGKGFESADKLIKASDAIRAENDQFLKDTGLAPDGSVAYDLGGLVTTAGAAIGLNFVTKNPFAAAALFSNIQKNRIYLEAKDKGFKNMDADQQSALASVIEGGLEFIGGGVAIEALKEGKPFLKYAIIAGEESVQEFLQQGGEEAVTQMSGLRDKDIEGAFKRMFYAGALGMVGGGGAGVIVGSMTKVAKEEGIPKQVAQNMAAKIQDMEPQIEDTFHDVMLDQTSPMRDNAEAQTHTKKIFSDFLSGKEVDTSNLSEEEQKLIKSNVDAGIEKIDAQQGTNLIPVPRKPETLSQFLKKAGGLSVDTGEARQFTKKENPQLGGVANKNGKLDLDHARELAVEAGFLHEGADINDLIAALDQEAGGVSIVRSSDLTALQERDQILQYNEQRDQANQHILEGSKQVKSFKAAFKEGVSAAQKDVKVAQGALINALEGANMRAEDRAKFIRKIKNIQTIKQLKKAAPGIEQKVSDLLDADTKRKLRERIKKVISSAKTRKDVSVDLLDNIRKLESDLGNTGILGKGIKETPISEFSDALNKAVTLVSEGKAKLAIQKEQKKQRMAQRLEDLQQDSVKISNINLSEAGLGERLSAMDKLKNLFIGGANYAQRLNLYKNPMDVIFDVMDGNKNYQGANSKVFKQTIDAAYSRFLQLKEDTTRDVKNLTDELKLDDRNFERIGAYAALQQENGYEKLKATGVTDAEIDALVLEPEELEMYDLMRQKLDSLRPALKEVMSTVYNKEFKNVKDYFPFMTDFRAMKDFEIQDMFGEDVFMISDTPSEFNKKDVNKGFTKERKGGKQKIRIDGLDVFLSHVENATYLIEMGQDIKELGELAATKDFQEISGDLGQEVVLSWIDLLARKGRAAGSVDFIDTFRKNAGTAALAFKLSSALVQPTALMDGAAFVGGEYISRGVVNVTQSEWREFIYKNMPELRERIGDDPNYLDMGGDTLVSNVRDAGFWALKKLDMMAASAVASGAYIKSVELRGGEVDLSNPDPIAIADAQLVVRRTQSSSFAKDAAPIISQGKMTGNVSVDKLILQFQSFLLNRWSLIQHDMWGAGLREGNTAHALNIATWLVLANVAEYFIKHWTKELIGLITGSEPPKDDSTVEEKAIKQAISNVPFVSSIVSAGQYGSVPVPAISMVEKVAEEIQYGNRSKKEEKKIKHYSQAAILGAGTVFGIPGTTQVQQIVKGAFDTSYKNKY